MFLKKKSYGNVKDIRDTIAEIKVKVAEMSKTYVMIAAHIFQL